MVPAIIRVLIGERKLIDSTGCAQELGSFMACSARTRATPNWVGDRCNIWLVALPHELADHALSDELGGEEKAAGHRKG